MNNLSSVTTSQTKKFPDFLVILFFVQLWERFSYYGMRALLVLFLTSSLGFEDTRAYAVYSLFAAICYTAPVFGGYLADKLVGFRDMVLLGAITILLGHLSLFLIGFDNELIYIGLSLVAVGSGMFKGNTASLLGSCYKEDDPERSRGFTLFYVSTNLGSVLSSILCGYVAHLYGWHYGFGLAAIGMFLGLIVFIKFTRLLGNSGLSPRPDLMSKGIYGLNIYVIIMLGTLAISFLVSRMLVFSEIFSNLLAISGTAILGVFLYLILKLPAVERKNLLMLLILLFFFLFFFAFEMQLGSLINLFAKRNVVDEVFGITIPPSLSQAINPFSILVFGTIMSTYMKFDKKYRTAVFAFGIFTTAICFLILYIGCVNADINGKVNYVYLLIAISFMGLGELLIAPFIQEQASILAPKHLKGLIMGMVMLAVAFSNLAGIIIAKFMSVPTVQGEVDNFVSLAIYQQGFLHIGLLSIAFTALFMFCYRFVYKTIMQQK